MLLSLLMMPLKRLLMIFRLRKMNNLSKPLQQPSLNSKLALLRETLIARLLLKLQELGFLDLCILDLLPGKSATTRRKSTPNGKKILITGSHCSDFLERNRLPLTKPSMIPSLLLTKNWQREKKKKLSSMPLREILSMPSLMILDLSSIKTSKQTTTRWLRLFRPEEIP